MKSLKKALAKNNTLKVLKIEDLANGEEVEEEIFEELGKALGVSTSLEEFSFSVLKLDQPSGVLHLGNLTTVARTWSFRKKMWNGFVLG